MSIAYMREKVAGMYDNAGWKERVNNMPDRQVKAIYMYALEHYPEKLNPNYKNDGVKYRQMTIFDFI